MLPVCHIIYDTVEEVEDAFECFKGTKKVYLDNFHSFCSVKKESPKSSLYPCCGVQGESLHSYLYQKC